MRLSKTARSLLMRAYTGNRAVAPFDQAIEQELIASRFLRYSDQPPLMVITREGASYCRKRVEGRDNG
jgi:hypothetical protein